MSALVANPKDRFSRVVAHIEFKFHSSCDEASGLS